MTRNRVLLVEGDKDRRAFRRLIRAIAPCDSRVSLDVDIDTADILRSPKGRSLGNREKIEAFCEQLKDKHIADKFVGFVDREFREFYLDGNGPMQDLLTGHFVHERLVWSRGHSIENYFFDLDILREAFQLFADSESSHSALETFRRVFGPSLFLACAASLAANDTGFLTLVAGSIDWKIIQLSKDSVAIDVAQWKDRLVNDRGATECIADQIIDRYNYWHSRAAVSQPQTVRWLCQGHIGFRMIWAVYARCLYEASGRTERETVDVLRADEKVRFCACAEFWAKRTTGGGVPYPSAVLAMLGVKPPRVPDEKSS